MEQFANKPETTLSAAITTTGATSCTVASGSSFPSSGTFRILIDTEIIKVTNVSGTTWTIARGDGGTTATTHSSGATVYGIVTKEALDALTSIYSNGAEISNRRVLNFIGADVADDSGNSRVNITVAPSFEANWTKPVAANFSIVNPGGSASFAANSKGSLFFRAPALGGNAPRGLAIPIPSTPYTITLRIEQCCWDIDYAGVGAGWWDDTNSRVHALVMYKNNIQVNQLSYTSYNTTNINFNAGAASQFKWIQLTDDGTNRSFKIGVDGENWLTTLWSGSRTTWATPTHVGVYCEPNNSSYDAAVLLNSWAQT